MVALIGNMRCLEQANNGDEVSKYNVWVIEAGKQQAQTVNNKP